MNKNATIWTVIGIIVIIIIIILVSMRGGASTAAPATTGYQQSDNTAPAMPVSASTTTEDAGSTTAKTYTVTYGDSGFSPNTLTINKGDAVTFLNRSSNNMWIASDPHPTHEGYSGTTRAQHCPDTLDTAFDQCNTGDSYTFTFQKVGTWGYHNHAVDEDKGTIIVK